MEDSCGVMERTLFYERECQLFKACVLQCGTEVSTGDLDEMNWLNCKVNPLPMLYPPQQIYHLDLDEHTPFLCIQPLALQSLRLFLEHQSV